jgi:hypothetical protein
MDRLEESLFDWVTRVLRDPDPAAELSRVGAGMRAALVESLEPEEVVRVVLRGSAGQAIAGTDTRVIVLRSDAVLSWRYLDVCGIDVDQHVVGGAIGIRVPGGGCVMPAAGDWDVIRARVATLRGLIAGAHSDSVRAEPHLVAL